jgi:hypothetical protein
MTITDYGHAERLVRVPQSFVAAFIFSGLIGSSGVFVIRILAASEKFSSPILLRAAHISPLEVPYVCWTLSFLRLLGSVVGAVFAFSMQSVATYEARFRWLLVTVWIASVVNDLAIALTLVYLLYRARVTVHERCDVPVINMSTDHIAWKQDCRTSG